MRTLIATLFLFCAVGAFAQATNRITAKITVTTATSNNFAFTLNGNTRTFTNDVTAAASQITTNHTVAGSASNFYYHVVATPFSGPVVPLNYTNGSNVIFLRGALGQAMSVTILSNWATVEYSTQVFSSGMIAVRVPIANEAASVQTKVASELVTGINAYTTNAFATNSPALTNHLSLGPQVQRASNKVFEAFHATGGNVSNSFFTNITRANIGALRSTNALIHNGSATNFTIDSSPSGRFTNLFGYGGTLSNFIAHTLTVTNFSSPGDASGSQQIGAGATASGISSSAFGQNASALQFGSAFGYTAVASEGAVAVGQDTSAYTNSVAIGNTTSANALNTVAIGPSAIADYANSGAYGPGAATTATNQIVLGGAAYHVSIPGELRNSKQTNVWNTGTNRFDLAVSYSRTNITTLANGVNLIDPGFKTAIYVSGPTAAYSIDKIQRGWDGRRIRIWKKDVYTLTIVNESGSGGGTDADRTLTGTGGNVSITNNPGYADFDYDSAASRWNLAGHSN